MTKHGLNERVEGNLANGAEGFNDATWLGGGGEEGDDLDKERHGLVGKVGFGLTDLFEEPFGEGFEVADDDGGVIVNGRARNLKKRKNNEEKEEK